MNWKLECIPQRKITFSNANQCQKEKQSGNNVDGVLNDIKDLESESAKIMFDAMFL